MALKRLSMLIDIGANLTDPVFRGIYREKQRHSDDFKVVLQRAKQSGVDKIIVTGGSLSESRHALELVRATNDPNKPFPQLFSTVGVHPTRCSEFRTNEFGNDPQLYLDALLQLCQEGQQAGNVVAIGECGLDYDRLQFCDKETQLEFLERQFELAEKTQLPMFLHNRNTDGDFYAMIKKNRHRFRHGVVHSFTGTVQEAQELLQLDLYIGINGCSLKTQENIDAMCSIPSNRLMIETDAPWCDIRATHAGFQHVKTKWTSKKAEKHDTNSMVKSRNEPCTLVQVLEVISAARGEDQATLAQTVHQNTCRVFFPELIQ